MKCYAIDNVISYLDKPAISPFHAAMFHGTFYRGGQGNAPARLGAGPIEPAMLVKNVHHIGDCFSPMNFVISKKVRGRLGTRPNIEFVQVGYQKLFDYPYEKHDLSFYDRMAELDVLDDDLDEAIEGLIESQPNNLSLAERVGSHYEVVHWRHQDVFEKFPEARPVPFEVPFTLTHAAPFGGRLSPRMMNEYPLLWTEHGTVIRHDVFEILEPFLDDDYYSWVSFEV